MRAAVYARQRGDTPDQTREGLDHQIHQCCAAAQRDGATAIMTFTDTCGAEEADRPGFRALSRHIDDGNLDVVYVASMDRMHRTVVSVLETLGRMALAGCHLVTLSEGQVISQAWTLRDGLLHRLRETPLLQVQIQSRMHDLEAAAVDLRNAQTQPRLPKQ